MFSGKPTFFIFFRQSFESSLSQNGPFSINLLVGFHPAPKEMILTTGSIQNSGKQVAHQQSTIEFTSIYPNLIYPN
jgi:hypothetical protein